MGCNGEFNPETDTLFYYCTDIGVIGTIAALDGELGKEQ